MSLNCFRRHLLSIGRSVNGHRHSQVSWLSQVASTTQDSMATTTSTLISYTPKEESESHPPASVEQPRRHEHSALKTKPEKTTPGGSRIKAVSVPDRKPGKMSEEERQELLKQVDEIMKESDAEPFGQLRGVKSQMERLNYMKKIVKKGHTKEQLQEIAKTEVDRHICLRHALQHGATSLSNMGFRGVPKSFFGQDVFKSRVTVPIKAARKIIRELYRKGHSGTLVNFRKQHEKALIQKQKSKEKLREKMKVKTMQKEETMKEITQDQGPI